MIIHKKQSSGFALLMSLIVVGVVVSVGLTILDLSIKQLMLSTNSKDSEIALHAANAGLECVQYWRNHIAEEFENGDNVTLDCFGVSKNVTKADVSSTPNDNSNTAGKENAYKYDLEFDWGAIGAERCSKVMMIFLTSSNESAGVTVTGLDAILPNGYSIKSPNDKKFCEPGGRCAIISVQGYNKPCANIGTHGTLQREVLLES